MIASHGSQNASITIVIPTMWKAPELTRDFFRLLSESSFYFELIVVNNSPESTPEWFRTMVHDEKVTFEIKCKNIFVNPAWNLGVNIAKTEFVALVNDDICFDPDNLYFALTHLRHFGGVVGIDSISFKIQSPNTRISQSIDIQGGWATMMLFHRSAYRTIPDPIKIWCGDLVVLKTIRPACSIVVQDLKGHMNATTSGETFHEQKQTDLILYNEWLRRNLTKIAFVKAKQVLKSILQRLPFAEK
jgi:glycosyltransferase involved in cell wall biosynthesis